MDTTHPSTNLTAEVLIEGLADRLVPHLVPRLAPEFVGMGFVQIARDEPDARPRHAQEYDEATCARFLDPQHLGDGVLERARIFFGELERSGEIMSLDLAAALKLKGPRSIPANLTIPLKKSAWRLRLEQPWDGDDTGPRTIWRDRDGIASRMVKAIEAERLRRGLV
jgi:hypothetical protein